MVVWTGSTKFLVRWMDVSEAETVVTLLHQTGILKFADNG